MLSILRMVLGGIGVLMFLWYGGVERFYNLELTETQLFIKFWPQYLVGFLLTVPFLIRVKKDGT